MLLGRQATKQQQGGKGAYDLWRGVRAGLESAVIIPCMTRGNWAVGCRRTEIVSPARGDQLPVVGVLGTRSHCLPLFNRHVDGNHGHSLSPFCAHHRLFGQVVRRPPRERKIPGSNPACAGIFSGSSHTSDFKIGTPVAILPGPWRYLVSAGTGRPGVSIL